MAIVLALGAALAYGLGDFVGGVLSKRAHVYTVVLLSQLVTCVVLVLVLPLDVESFSLQAMVWGAFAGLGATLGVSLLYRGLAIGRMGVVAPITAVLAAAIPLSFGLAIGERPGSLALIGVGVGLLAVTLISRAPEPEPAAETRSSDPRPAPRGLPEAFGSGLGFGLFFILLQRAPAESGLWPLAGTRIALVGSMAALTAVSGASFRPPAGTASRLVGLGIVNLAADLLYLLASRTGLLSVVAVVTSLYPAATVALARIFLKEPMVRQQLIGFFCAAVSVTLIALK